MFSIYFFSLWILWHFPNWFLFDLVFMNNSGLTCFLSCYRGILGARFANQTPHLKKAGNISNYTLGSTFANALDWFIYKLEISTCSLLISFLFGFILSFSWYISFLFEFSDTFLIYFFLTWLLGHPSGTPCQPDPSFEKPGNISNFTLEQPLPTSFIYIYIYFLFLF